MAIIFTNSENNKTSNSYILLFNFTDKINIRRGEKSCCIMKS